MKKFMIFLFAGFACMALSCSDENDEGGNDGGNTMPAIQVTFSEITGSSFTASWKVFEGADSYRYEVSSTKNGQTTAVAAENIQDLSFTLRGLAPSTDYTVRVAAKAGGKTISDWFTETVTTSGESGVTFEIIPYERYYEKAFVYPYARVKPSDPDVYYWVSAIPAASEADPRAWIKEDIDFYLERGLVWDDLIEDHLILKGDSESAAFVFNGYDHYCFIVAQVSRNMSDIVVEGEVSRSYRFWYESQDSQIQHESTYDQFVGEWLLQTTGTVHDVVGGGVDIDEIKEESLVTITASEDKKSLYLKGLFANRNRFSDVGIKMDFEPSDDNYNKVGIFFPQKIKEEDGVVWKYVSWYNFNGTVGNEEVHTFLPYDDKMFESMPSWSKGFTGFIGNLNRTVIKLCPESYIDGAHEGAYMLSIWPYGISKSGNVEQDKLLNGRHEEPVGPYTLVRKDVVDGLEMQLPDTGVADTVGKALSGPETRSTDTLRGVFDRRL